MLSVAPLHLHVANATVPLTAAFEVVLLNVSAVSTVSGEDVKESVPALTHATTSACLMVPLTPYAPPSVLEMQVFSV